MMTTPLQSSFRVLQRHVQCSGGLLLRSSSTIASGSTSKVKKSDKQYDNNSLIQPVFRNRNPRNLEMMTIANKPKGYHLESFEVEYWHKLVVKAGQHRVLAEVVHNSGVTVVSASSTEFPIRRFLYRPSDMSAYQIVGKVIAQRCLESGLNHVYCEVKPGEGTKLAALMEEVQAMGLALEEPPNYSRPIAQSKTNPTKPWDVIV